jgi:hypothetical protein
MRPLALVVVLVALLAAACGGGGGDETADPAETLTTFLNAVADRDVDGAWELLGPRTQQRVGSVEAFRNGLYTELSEGAASFARADEAATFGREVDDDFAVGVVSGQRTVEGMRELGAFAAPMRRVDGNWRVEIFRDVEVTPVRPDPSAPAAPETEVAARVAAPRPIDETFLWVDGNEVDTDSTGPTVSGRPDDPLSPGTHIAVAAARAGDELGAAAWAFGVR